ncbi:MAG TPA: hypothetical protein VLL50_07635 [Usitatibacter sp.]|nr:hypothetical protein [Usitatibacter sp.]
MRIAVLIALLALTAVSRAASFDCRKAATPTEKLICANQHISDLDEYLGRYYYTARAQTGRGAVCLVPTQRDWLNGVRDACKDVACLERAYLDRLAELDALQIGATELKNVDLPNVKGLVWAIGPELDKVAAPTPKTHEPLVVTGRILDDMEGGNGFMIQDARGTKFVLLGSMFIDKPNAMAIDRFARETGSAFEVHGEAEPSADGQVNFSPAACRLIYRLPKK